VGGHNRRGRGDQNIFCINFLLFFGALGEAHACGAVCALTNAVAHFCAHSDHCQFVQRAFGMCAMTHSHLCHDPFMCALTHSSRVRMRVRCCVFRVSCVCLACIFRVLCSFLHLLPLVLRNKVCATCLCWLQFVHRASFRFFGVQGRVWLKRTCVLSGIQFSKYFIECVFVETNQ